MVEYRRGREACDERGGVMATSHHRRRADQIDAHNRRWQIVADEARPRELAIEAQVLERAQVALLDGELQVALEVKGEDFDRAAQHRAPHRHDQHSLGVLASREGAVDQLPDHDPVGGDVGHLAEGEDEEEEGVAQAAPTGEVGKHTTAFGSAARDRRQEVDQLRHHELHTHARCLKRSLSFKFFSQVSFQITKRWGSR